MGDAEDPFKKYWVAILVGFVMTGLWLWMPIMETSVGSTHVDATKPAVDPNAAQSLDSLDNPSGAPGLNLTMDATKRKNKSDEPIESMLYSAPAEAGATASASGAPIGSASGGIAASLADQLKGVGDKAKANGWGEKAQRGFDAPKLSGGGGLSGLGGTSGGGSSSASAGLGAFGSHNAQIGFGSTRGLRDDGSADRPAGGSAAALRALSKTAAAAAVNRSADGAVSSLSRAFDGAKATAPGAPAGTGAGGTYEALDTAPVNLKLNDPKLDKKEMKDPPGVAVPEAASDNTKQMMMMLATAVIGGAVGGATGGVIAAMGQMMMQQQQAQEAEARSKARQEAAAKKGA